MNASDVKRIYIMNTSTKHSKKVPSEYFAPADCTLVFIRKGNTTIVAQTYGNLEDTNKYYTTNTPVAITYDTGMGHRDGGYGIVVGLAQGNNVMGEEVTKQVNFYVFK